MRFRQLALAGAAVAGLAPLPALAHPHIFIETQVEVIFTPEGQVEAVRITWLYDELFSLSLISDRGFDQDFDGALTPEEKAALNGFDMDWDPDYPGDSYALLGEAPLTLGGPSDWTADYVDGMLVSTHLRKLAAPVAVGTEPFILQAYDPSYYVSYRISGTPVVTGAPDCGAQIYEPDMALADQIYQSAIEEITGSDLEGDFPAIGAAFADEVRVTCAARS